MNFTIIILPLSILCFSQSVFSSTTNSLDTFLLNSAFDTLVRHRPRTGALYTALLPSNLSGISASIVRLRSRRLWNIGANFTHFQIPSRTKTMPHVKRLAIVYQDLGNWSSYYYNIPGYTIVTSVVGFEVFNASNPNTSTKTIKRVHLNTRGRLVVIRFSNLGFLGGVAKCVMFSKNGSFQLSGVDVDNVCYSRDEGRFAIVVPNGDDRPKKKKMWYFWILLVGFVIGLGGVCLVVYYLMKSMKFLKSQKIEVMEKQADEDLMLETIWVGDSKMPFATVTRTQATIEDGGF
ncbi:hypothetical protein M5689_008243 [Euphorbia peplus]|nr:hypothetical protein M5689_008243 [Euphorbia peplus]